MVVVFHTVPLFICRSGTKDGKNVDSENSFEKFDESQTYTHPKTGEEAATAVPSDSQGRPEIATVKDRGCEESTKVVEAEKDQNTAMENEEHLEENKEVLVPGLLKKKMVAAGFRTIHALGLRPVTGGGGVSPLIIHWGYASKDGSCKGKSLKTDFC